MEHPNQPEQRRPEPWWMALVLFLPTVATAVGALVVGFVLGWVNGNGTNRNSWGDRGDHTFHFTLWCWLLGWGTLCLYHVAKRKPFSATGIFLGMLAATMVYLSF